MNTSYENLHFTHGNMGLSGSSFDGNRSEKFRSVKNRMVFDVVVSTMMAQAFMAQAFMGQAFTEGTASSFPSRPKPHSLHEREAAILINVMATFVLLSAMSRMSRKYGFDHNAQDKPQPQRSEPDYQKYQEPQQKYQEPQQEYQEPPRFTRSEYREEPRETERPDMTKVKEAFKAFEFGGTTNLDTLTNKDVKQKVRVLRFRHHPDKASRRNWTAPEKMVHETEFKKLNGYAEVLNKHIQLRDAEKAAAKSRGEG